MGTHMATQTAYNPREDPVLRDFLAAAREAVGKDPIEVLLFGSRARGDNDPTSDYDLLMVYVEITPAMKRLIRSARSLVGLRHDTVISTFALTAAEARALAGEPFIIIARREGVRVA
jgi:uncharacterized protein